MKRLALILGLGALLAACSPAGDTAQDDLIVLTVSGAITETNRPPRNDFTDPLFTNRQIELGSAYEFSYNTLFAMPQHEVIATYSSWEGHVVVAKGPRLLDVLDLAGATGSNVTLQAIDGYTYSFDRGTITNDYVLALRINGEPLHLGGRGPVWLVIPEDASPSGRDSDEALVWGTYSIHVSD